MPAESSAEGELQQLSFLSRGSALLPQGHHGRNNGAACKNLEGFGPLHALHCSWYMTAAQY